VIGEEQILGQVKLSFAKARESGMLYRHFNILSNMAIRSGKKARSETNISFGGSSLSWAAVIKAEEILGSGMRVHRTLLPHVVCQIENLVNLDRIGPTARVIALPAKWKTESAPARVIALMDS
jgi:kynurenine formamidase